MQFEDDARMNSGDCTRLTVIIRGTRPAPTPDFSRRIAVTAAALTIGSKPTYVHEALRRTRPPAGNVAVADLEGLPLGDADILRIFLWVMVRNPRSGSGSMDPRDMNDRLPRRRPWVDESGRLPVCVQHVDIPLGNETNLLRTGVTGSVTSSYGSLAIDVEQDSTVARALLDRTRERRTTSYAQNRRHAIEFELTVLPKRDQEEDRLEAPTPTRFSHQGPVWTAGKAPSDPRKAKVRRVADVHNRRAARVDPFVAHSQRFRGHAPLSASLAPYCDAGVNLFRHGAYALFSPLDPDQTYTMIMRGIEDVAEWSPTGHIVPGCTGLLPSGMPVRDAARAATSDRRATVVVACALAKSCLRVLDASMVFHIGENDHVTEALGIQEPLSSNSTATGAIGSCKEGSSLWVAIIEWLRGFQPRIPHVYDVAVRNVLSQYAEAFSFGLVSGWGTGHPTPDPTLAPRADSPQAAVPIPAPDRDAFLHARALFVPVESMKNRPVSDPLQWVWVETNPAHGLNYVPEGIPRSDIPMPAVSVPPVKGAPGQYPSPRFVPPGLHTTTAVIVGPGAALDLGLESLVYARRSQRRFRGGRLLISTASSSGSAENLSLLRPIGPPLWVGLSVSSTLWYGPQMETKDDVHVQEHEEDTPLIPSAV